MKTIGLIGGMSWESSLEYYRIINTATKERLGGLHSAECLMFSFDFAEIEALQASGDWRTASHRLAQAARQIEQGGGQCIVLCTNTMHKCFSAIEATVSIDTIHIADPTAQAIQSAGLQKVALLGTAYTMEQDFYKGRLIEKFGLDVLIPDEVGREQVHRIIYEELVLGDIRDESREVYQGIIQQLADAGAEGVILGCTEIELLIKPEHSPIPTFDTTRLHALAAVDWALA